MTRQHPTSGPRPPLEILKPHKSWTHRAAALCRESGPALPPTALAEPARRDACQGREAGRADAASPPGLRLQAWGSLVGTVKAAGETPCGASWSRVEGLRASTARPTTAPG